MEASKIYIIGAGGFGKEVKSILPQTAYEFAGFVDDDLTRKGVVSTIDKISDLSREEVASFSIAIGSSKTRRLIYSRLPVGLGFPSLVHPSVIFQEKETIKMGEGCFIGAASIFTCDITMGNFCLINLNCTIGHDVKMGDFCSLMPAVNLSGNVTLEEGVFIGTGATVLQGITIGKGAIVAAGALVNQDVAPGQTVVGVPARVLPLG